MTRLHMDAKYVRAEIERLVAAYPELAEDEDLRLDTIDGETDLTRVIERALAEKLDADAMAAAVKERADALAERRSRYERKAEAMKELIMGLMEAADVPKLQLAEATLSLRDPVASVEITDILAIPQGYYRLEKKADKASIRKALLAGEAIPGAELTLGKTSLTVRTN